jgi:hypothetical protein
MKRFIVTVLCVSVFFIGLGTLVENVGAKFKSDEKALALIVQARQAIGGEQSLAAVRSMTITAKATKTFEVEGVARTEQGDVEINMQLPDKFGKMLKIGKHDGAEGPGIFEKRMDVIVAGRDGEGLKMKVTASGGLEGEEGAKQIIKIRKADGTVTDGEKGDVVFVRKAGDEGTGKSENGEIRTIVINKNGNGEGHGMGVGVGGGEGHEKFRHNEMLRTSMALLLTAPEGLDVGYTYAGEESVDGSSCDVIAAEAAGSSFRLYLDKSSHLPRMMTFQDAKPMVFMFRSKEGETKGSGGEPMTFTRKIGAPETAQFAIKFSDYRTVNGVQLPFRWTQTMGGKDDEVLDITGYDINPANIADKFQHEKVFVRTRKPE